MKIWKSGLWVLNIDISASNFTQKKTVTVCLYTTWIHMQYNAIFWFSQGCVSTILPKSDSDMMLWFEGLSPPLRTPSHHRLSWRAYPSESYPVVFLACFSPFHMLVELRSLQQHSTSVQVLSATLSIDPRSARWMKGIRRNFDTSLHVVSWGSLQGWLRIPAFHKYRCMECSVWH